MFDRGSLLGPNDTFFGGEKRDLDESKTLVKSNRDPRSDITLGCNLRTWSVVLAVLRSLSREGNTCDPLYNL
jgi:hypothetical protein